MRRASRSDLLLERQATRVALVRLRSLGDCVLTTPALEILKSWRPDLRLAVVVEDRFRAVFTGNPHIEEILPPDWRALRRFAPHVCVNLHGGPASLRLTLLSGARYRAGFGHFRHRWAYNVRIPRAQEILGEERTVHTAEHLASAMFFLGAPRIEIPRARLYAEPAPAARPYALLHPMASAPEKTWPAERFLEAAGHLAAAWGLDPVFLAGPGEDAGAFREYQVLAGRPLEEIKSWMAGASFFLGNDSGPAHMAAAFSVPSVVLFGASDAAVWGPWKAPSETMLAPGGIRSIPVDRVLAAMERLRVRT